MSEVTNAPVTFQVREDVAYITLDRPPLNILTAEMMDALAAAVDRAGADPTVKAVALKANGKVFSAGADVEAHRPGKAEAMMDSFGRLFRALDALEVPAVMAVAGAALGAGFELAMMADVLLATEEATFGQPEIRLGFFAPVGVAWLPARVGPARAMEITCSGRIYSAAEMQAMGLVTKIMPVSGLEEALESALKDFRRVSPRVMRLNVRTLKRSRGIPFSEALPAAEKVFLEELLPLEDVLEGIASFNEKRKPAWKNR